MKEVVLTINISKPPKTVFEFTTDPNNTPEWIPSIVAEITNEWPPRLGTIYRNRGQNRDWAEYKITDFEPGKSFTLSQVGGNYHVRYTFTPQHNYQTLFEYREWVDTGEIEDPFTMETLQNLKRALEKNS